MTEHNSYTTFGEDNYELQRSVRDSEQLCRFFMRRDEMNAEVHLTEGDRASVRYSPITYASERVCKYFWSLLYVEPPTGMW